MKKGCMMMNKMNNTMMDIRPRNNTKVPPYNYPEVLAAPAFGAAWEGSPWNAFLMMNQDED